MEASSSAHGMPSVSIYPGRGTFEPYSDNSLSNLPEPRVLRPHDLERTERMTWKRQAGEAAVDVEQLYMRHRDGLFNYFRRCGLSREASEDLRHAVFAVLLENPGRYDPSRGPVEPFLYGIARTLRLAWSRMREKDAAGVEPVGSGAEWRGDQGLRALEVQEAVASLHIDLREALVLREYHGFDYQEIARIQGIPVGTVRSRLARAREHLRDWFLGRGQT